MNPENAIEVREVRKHFKVYKDKGRMLRERIVHINRNRYEKREVLKGISFEIKKGQSVGLIGKNGCGKSTTLKLLTKILRPNEGVIDIQGRVCSLIELGAGFHPDMSGRENIYINASIFGIKAKEVDRRLNDIIHFSELEEFIDNPVRTYSSGMYMRLAFSVAINVDADILLIDEILAVGDNSFQTKCFNKLKSLKDKGTTIVIVSHALGQVERLCDRAIWIDNGKIRADGPARQICREYLDRMEESRLERAELEYRLQLEEAEQRKRKEEKRIKEEEERIKQNRIREKEEREQLRKKKEREKKEEELQKKKREEELRRNSSCRLVAKQSSPDARREGNGKVQFTSVKLLDDNKDEKTVFGIGDPMIVEMEYQSTEPGTEVNFVIGITRDDWVYCYGTSFRHKEGKLIITQERGKVTIRIDCLNLLRGKYSLEVRILNRDNQISDYLVSIIDFKVTSCEKKETGVFSMPYSWTTDDEQIFVGKFN